jgi:hypothetical protein
MERNERIGTHQFTIDNKQIQWKAIENSSGIFDMYSISQRQDTYYYW